MKSVPKIDFSWSLFLDRDGVINKKRDGDYVKSVDEFEFLPKAIETITYLSSLFHKVIVVTNQQGIGKGLMTDMDLKLVHQHMKQHIKAQGGRIDAIFHAPQMSSENSPLRKPNIGMALLAKKQFPSIQFEKSIMVGDSLSDMEFAKRNGMTGIFVGQSDDYLSINSLNECIDLFR